MRACTPGSVSPHADMVRGRRGEVAGIKHKYLLFFHLTASARSFLYGTVHYLDWS